MLISQINQFLEDLGTSYKVAYVTKGTKKNQSFTVEDDYVQSDCYSKKNSINGDKIECILRSANSLIDLAYGGDFSSMICCFLLVAIYLYFII
jgi:hypothetical protein